MPDQNYPGFPYAAHELSAYIFSLDFFVIALTSKQTVSHTPRDPEAFKVWLHSHGIRDISKRADLPHGALAATPARQRSFIREMADKLFSAVGLGAVLQRKKL